MVVTPRHVDQELQLGEHLVLAAGTGQEDDDADRHQQEPEAEHLADRHACAGQVGQGLREDPARS